MFYELSFLNDKNFFKYVLSSKIECLDDEPSPFSYVIVSSTAFSQSVGMRGAARRINFFFNDHSELERVVEIKYANMDEFR